MKRLILFLWILVLPGAGWTQLPPTSTGSVTYDSVNNWLPTLKNGHPPNLPINSTVNGVPIGAGGGVTDGDKGDITVSGGGTVWSVDSGAIDFSELAGKPTTIAGYGITDFNSLGDARWSLLGHTHTFASLTSKPTTAAGYGITNGTTIDLWGTITPSAKQDALDFTPENVANKRTSFQVTPDDTHYPSEKLVKDSLDAKQGTITTGTTAQYFRGDLSLATFPTNVSSFTNDAGYLTGVTVNAPLSGAGTSASHLSMHVADTTHDGYLSSTDWNTFNNKQPAGSYESPLTFQYSLSRSTNTVTLSGDSATPGNSKYYGTNGSGTRGFYDLPTTDLSNYQTLDGTLALAGFSSITGRIGSSNLPLGAQLYDNAGTPKLAADFDARKFYAPNGSTIAFQLTDNANWDAYLGLICHDGLTVQSGGEFLINQWSWSPDYGTLLYYGNVVFDIEGTNVHLFAKNIQASGVFYGDGSGLTNVPYSSVTGTPVIGTDVEAWSANLDAWSALATSAKQDHSANLDGWSALATSAKANSGANTDITSLLLNQTGLVVKGGSANALIIKPNETLSAARILNLKVNDADRTVDLSGNFTLSHSITLDTDGTGTRTLNIGAGGTLGSAAFTAFTAYDAAGTAAAVVSDTAYDATTWNGVTGIAPSKNAVRDWIETLGSAAYTASSAYATSAQGTKADNAGAVNGIVKSNGSASFSAVTDNSSNWDTAYTDRLKWDGGATGLTAATGRTSLGLGTMATQAASGVAITGGTLAGLTGLAIRDTSAAFDVTLAATSSTTLTAGHTLTLDLVNADRTLKLTGSPTLSGFTATGTGTLALGTKTLTVSNSITLAGTDSTTMTFPSTSATIARTDAANTFTGHQTIEGVTSTGATGTGNFVFDASPTIVTPSFTTGFTIGGAAASGKIPIGNGTNYVASTPTYPNAASTSGKLIQSDGTNFGTSTMTWPSGSAPTSGKVMVSDGSNIVASTPTFPNTSATSGKVIKSDGTNWVASTETYATPGATGAVLQSDGTNWVRVAKTIAVSGTASSTTNNTAAETNLFTVTIPANAMNVNGNLRITVLWKMTGTNGTKTPVIRHNTTSGATSGGTVLWSIADAAGTLTHRVVVDAWNVNSASSQIFYPHSNANSLGTNSNAPETGGIDTSQISYLNFNAFVANSGDTIGVVGYTVEIINP